MLGEIHYGFDAGWDSSEARTKRCSSLALTSCGVDNPAVASC
jgi:hypothetical protein